MIDWNFEKLVFFETRKHALSRSREKGNKSSGCNSFSIVHAQKHGVKYPKTINKVSKLNGYTLKPFNSILKIKIIMKIKTTHATQYECNRHYVNK